MIAIARALALVAAGAQVDGVPSALGAYVDTVEEVVGGSAWSIAEIEVKNPLGVAAEPLAFLVRWSGEPGAQLVVPRVPLPHVDRHGRPIAPGGHERYAVQLPLSVTAANASNVTVLSACFSEPGPPVSPDVVLGRDRKSVV